MSPPGIFALLSRKPLKWFFDGRKPGEFAVVAVVYPLKQFHILEHDVYTTLVSRGPCAAVNDN